MATAHSHGAGEVPCPDPSVHEKHNKLADQASTAALYVTNPQRQSKDDVLGKDGKLSASSAAASLKYAKAQDLPSFPTVGVASTSNSAGAAAMLAKDYKMKDLWHPETSEAGSRAALLAARDGGKLDLWHPTASKEGNSAATLAMRNKTLSPQLDRGYTPEGRNNALLAATKSQKLSREPAAPSPSPSPALYPDQANSARNALSAATASSRNSVRSPPLATKEGPGLDSPAMQAARVHNIGKNVNPEMWGERPPVEIEVEERKHQEALRASAVSMAKQMYDYQNRTALRSDPAGNAGAEAAIARNSTSTAPADLKSEALKYIHLQEAAQKLAHERLAKVDKNFENAKYREYYGYQDKPARSRLSMRGRPRTRSSDDQDVDSDDEEQARRVRGQMSQFSTALADVDAKKQAADRKALLAAAERNVHKSMSSMDDKVFQETGKVSQSKMDEWAAKARAKAQVDSELRQKNHGKTHVGGGKFMDQSEIEAIALARLKPTLDEISETAEKKRARDEELRLEKEEAERQKRNQKEKEREEKDEARKIKNEEKATLKKEKDERKALENERKVAEKEEKNRRSFDEKAAKAAEKEATRKSVEENAAVDSAEPKEQRKSFLSRLASKRKSKDVKKEETATAAAATPVVVAPADSTADISTGPPSTTVPAVVEPEESKASSSGAERSLDAAPEPLDRVESYHTGHHNDALPSPPITRKPDLERHISRIESSDGSSVSDWDEDDADERSKHGGLPVAAAGASGASVAASSPTHDELHARDVAERVVSAPITDNGAGAAPPLTTSRPSADLTSKEEKSVVPTTATTDHATAATPRPAVLSKPAPVIDEPRQSTASSRPSEEKEPKGFRGFFSKLRGKSKAENKLPAESPKATTTTAAAPAAAIGTTAITSTDASTSATPTVVPDHVGTDGPIGASTHIATAGRDLSPSSFRRHRSSDDKADVSSLSSASSSGLDEDDLLEGRTGRMARADKGKGKAPELPVSKKEVTSDVGSPTEESDTFEEARDHFDEGLAPQPAFAGQAKSQSPARETRFREEV